MGRSTLHRQIDAADSSELRPAHKDTAERTDSRNARCDNPMVRFFNTEGPVRPDRHYHVPPLDRVDLDELLGLVRDTR